MSGGSASCPNGGRSTRRSSGPRKRWKVTSSAPGGRSSPVMKSPGFARRAWPRTREAEATCRLGLRAHERGGRRSGLRQDRGSAALTGRRPAIRDQRAARLPALGVQPGICIANSETRQDRSSATVLVAAPGAAARPRPGARRMRAATACAAARQHGHDRLPPMLVRSVASVLISSGGQQGALAVLGAVGGRGGVLVVPGGVWVRGGRGGSGGAWWCVGGGGGRRGGWGVVGAVGWSWWCRGALA